MKVIKLLIKKILARFFILLGVIFLIMIILSFTSLPFWMYYYLGISHNNIKETPDYIVVLGGGGIPSESGLMRSYKAVKASKKYPKAKLIVALPGNVKDSTSSVNLMRHEIISRGIDSLKILLEPIGTNTRMQAIKISEMINFNANILIVTSPEHMYRATRVFIKAGLKNTGGEPAFEDAIESVLTYNDDELGGNKYILDIGNNTQLRYQFWNHFKYQIIVYREYFAIAYYKLKGWI